MEFSPITSDNRALFFELLLAYYRSGEDQDTPKEEIDAFITTLYNQVQAGEMRGELAFREEQTVGFALYGVDRAGQAFSRRPGFGTIYEIGLIPTVRGRGLGRALVAHVEKALRAEGVKGLYVCAYGPAQGFWKAMGYADSGETGAGGLPVYEKE